MQVPFYQEFTKFIFDIFMEMQNFFLPLGIPFGWMAWFYIVTVGPIFIALLVFIRRSRSAGGGLPEGVKAIIASTGDISTGIAGAKKLKFIKTPNDALIFLKIEENAIKQALSAIDYFDQRSELDESIKDQLIAVYQSRLDSVRTAIEKDEELKSIVATDDAIDKARSDYLRKLAAMSGTTVEVDTEDTGPSSVGMPSDTGAQATTAAASPGGGVPGGGAPGGGPPGGGAPGGGAPGGGAPGGSAPGGSAPGGSAPGGSAPGGSAPGGGPPGGGAPGGGPPGGGAPGGGAPGGGAPGGGAPGGGAPGGGAPGGGAPGGGAPGGGAPGGGAVGGKSSLQSEMLAEMERLKALMSGD